MSEQLRPEDWDFSKVPNGEAKWRMVLEYARESPTLARIKTAWDAQFRLVHPDAAEIGWMTYLSFLGCAAAEECLGPLPLETAHWVEARETTARLPKVDESSMISPETEDAPGPWTEAWNEAVKATGYWQMAPAQIRGLPLVLMLRSSSDAPWQFSEAQTENLPARFRWRAGWTINTLAIDWRRNTDKQIIEEFAQWLKLARPADCKKPPSRRGTGKEKDARGALKWLGTMRAWHFYSTRDRRFPRSLATNDKGADQQKGKAIKHFGKLFHFLDGEKPNFCKPNLRQIK